jgi:hypothetical protein
MSGEIEYGKCNTCGKDAPLQRKYYYYDIKCSCCGSRHNGKNYHFEIKWHCANCKPKAPSSIKIVLDNIDPVDLDAKDENYYIGKWLKCLKELPSENEVSCILPGQEIQIKEFVDGTAEGVRVARGIHNGYTFLLFNMNHVESYLKVNWELLPEKTNP